MKIITETLAIYFLMVNTQIIPAMRD